MPDLEIRPQKVVLSARQGQVFEAIQGGNPVEATWAEVGKGNGKIDPNGVYRSPWLVFRSRTVVIAARPKTVSASPPATPADATSTAGAPGGASGTAYYVASGTYPGGSGLLHDIARLFWPGSGRAAAADGAASGPSGTAIVELTPIGFWTQFLGIYWLACLVVLSWFVMSFWNRLCPTCTVMVSPPAVTLAPRQIQVFTANVPVSWAPLDAANGLYRAPDAVTAGQRVAVTVASKGNPEETASADVFLTPNFSFSLQPARSVIPAGGSVDLTPSLSRRTRLEWPKPTIGRLAVRKGSISGGVVFHAPKKVLRPTTVVILARAMGDTHAVAGAHVTILPAGSALQDDDCDSRTATGLLILIAAMGALGGLIHGISSFTTFVGNRELVSSWIWWYVFKPVVGALVAVVVYLVFRANLGSGDFALSSADCLKTAAFASLIGLFAEPATIKLKDIFDTLFTPRADPRGDAAGEVQAARLEKLDPPTLKVDLTPLPALKVIGTGFLKESQVKVGDAFRPTTFVSATELTVSLTADDIKKPQTLLVTVFNKPLDGAASNSLPLTVEQ